METSLRLIEPRKGSNPGGKGIVKHAHNSIDCYIKYCNASKLGKYPLHPSNQPIYEILTIEMAKKLGLVVPISYLLDNREQSLTITENDTPERFDIKKPFYFMSKFMGNPGRDLSEDEENRLETDSIYRELLAIGDITNKPHNYKNIARLGEPTKILYLDVGCNIVDAISGTISQRHEISKFANLSSRKTIHRLSKKLHQTEIENANGNSINLGDLVDSIPTMPLPVYKGKFVTLDQVTSEYELDEIKSLYMHIFDDKVTKYRKDSRVN